MRSRGRILDATLELIGNGGFESITIAAVAETAEVSRQTVYSIFGTREDLVSQAMAELTLDLMGRLHDRLEGVTSPADYVVELLVVGRSTARDHPVLSTLLEGDRGNPLFDDHMIERAKPVTVEVLKPMIELAPALEPHMDSIAEMTTMLGISVVLFGDQRKSDDEMRRFLHSWCDPAIAGFKG